jgi:nicotinate-nucleotide pyrophosphorylase (carboxylating)
MDWNSGYIANLIEQALREDVEIGDAAVAATSPRDAVGAAHIVARQELIVAGLPLAERIFKTLDPGMKVEFRASDGDCLEVGQEALYLEGKLAAILTGERAGLNFLGHLSGIATLTRKFVERVADARTKISCTRECLPGLRQLKEYAVKIGGGTNQWSDDALLLSENHIRLAGGIKAALDQTHTYVSSRMQPRAMTAYEAVGSAPTETEASSLTIQIAVRNEEELREALGAGAESVVLDNVTPVEARHLVEVARSVRSDCVMDISGDISLENVRSYAETGADFLSPCALGRSEPWADFRLLVERIEEK